MENSLGALLEKKNDDERQERARYSFTHDGGCGEQILAYREDVPRTSISNTKIKALSLHKTMLISKVDPMKYIITRSALSGNLVKQMGSLTNGIFYPFFPRSKDKPLQTSWQRIQFQTILP